MKEECNTEISFSDDPIVFVDNKDSVFGENNDLLKDAKPWKVIIADDEAEIHRVTKAVLKNFQFDNRPVELLAAYSGQETIDLLQEHPDTAIILLDVVMESDMAGLNTVRHIRRELDNNFVQIILRTGQPGHVPEQEVITKYNINGYHSKIELTSDKLYTAIISSLRAYQLSYSIHQLNVDLQRELVERKRMEAVLKEELENRKRAEIAAERAKRAKAEVLANMSHEFRTPLVGILGFADLGLMKIKRGNLSEDMVRDFFMRIKNSGTGLMRILNTLLDLSKLESGKVSFEMESADLFHILQEAIHDFRESLDEKKIEVEIRSKASSTIACFDYTLIGQVVRNLLSNAIKFSSNEKSIKIDFHDREYERSGKMVPFVECSITDYGIQVPEDELKTIFDKFVQSSNTDSCALGQGLGLSMCKEIVVAHSGKIWAQNEVDGGITFLFTLPRDPIS